MYIVLSVFLNENFYNQSNFESFNRFINQANYLIVSKKIAKKNDLRATALTIQQLKIYTNFELSDENKEKTNDNEQLLKEIEQIDNYLSKDILILSKRQVLEDVLKFHATTLGSRKEIKAN